MNWLEKILRKCGKGEDTNYQIMALELALRLSEIQYLNYKQAKALEKKNRQLKALRKAQNFGEIVTVKIWEPTHFRTIPTNKDKSERLMVKAIIIPQHILCPYCRQTLSMFDLHDIGKEPYLYCYSCEEFSNRKVKYKIPTVDLEIIDDKSE